MSTLGYDELTLLERPAWDVDGGIWFVSQTVTSGAPTPMYRHKPNMSQICGGLMGTSIRDKAGAITGVRYPDLDDSLRLYREGIELIIVFKDWTDLLTLALYRRQVSEEDVRMDVLFFNLAIEAGLKKEQWQILAQRMPAGSWIEGACRRRARFGAQLLAAA